MSVLLQLRQQAWRGTHLTADLHTRARRAFDGLGLQDAKQECGGGVGGGGAGGGVVGGGELSEYIELLQRRVACRRN